MNTVISLILSIIATLGLYPRAGFITGVTYAENELCKYTIQDAAGLTWSTIESWDDMSVGDGVSMIMYNNGTPENIYDDVIISAKYSGFSLPNWE